MKFRSIICVLVLLFVASVAYGEPLDAFKDLEGTLDIAGGTAHIPVMTQAAQDIMTFNPKIRITVAGGGSGVGVKQVGEGLAGIGNTGRPLKANEIEKYGLKSWPFAIDGVALAVHPDNPVKALTTEQVQKIYSGEITDWKDVGGNPGTINLYGREDGSGTRETFTDKLFGKGELSPAVNVVNSNGAMKTAIAQDKRAMGYVGIGHLDKSIAGVAIDGHVPSQENAASGEYPVVRNLFMNTKGEPTGLTAAFIDYIYSEPGAKIIENSGYIPLPKAK